MPFSHYRGTRRITEAYQGEGSLECLKLWITDGTPKTDGYTMVLLNQMLESNEDRCNGKYVEFLHSRGVRKFPQQQFDGQYGRTGTQSLLKI